MTRPAKTVHLDCDTGIDDAMALLYLLLNPLVEMTGISTVFGNISATTAASNCLRILELTGQTTIPVAQGAERTIRGDEPQLAPHVHGDDGLGNTGLPAPRTATSSMTAAELIIDTARRRPGEVHIVATGPLTNLAAALATEPHLPDLIQGVTVMGGAADAPGNQSAAAEANILHDPEAASAVFSAPWLVTLVPLDVTMRELLTERHRARLLAGGEIARFVGQITDFYFDFFHAESFSERCSPCHDALAAAIAVGEVTPASAPTINVQVDCSSGPSRGATICDTRGRYKNFPEQPGAHCRVVLETDGTFPDLLVQRLLDVR